MQTTFSHPPLSAKKALGVWWLAFVFFLFFGPIPAAGANLPQRQVPDSLSPGLLYLLGLSEPGRRQAFTPRIVADVLDFVAAPKKKDVLYYAAPQTGSASGYYESDIRRRLAFVLKYAFNPRIPEFVMTPSTTRLSHWLTVAAPFKAQPRFWDLLNDLATPLLVKGVEHMENTPDLFSGAYYAYDLNRAEVLFKYHNHNVLISIAKQRAVSDVGKKGYILGSDKDWDYYYSGQPGLAITGLGWMRSYIYSSYGISIYYELETMPPLVRCAVFRWVRAGWYRINVVKRTHIHTGLQRFANTFKTIMESPAMPSADSLSAAFSKINHLSPETLQARMQIYRRVLADRYPPAHRSDRKWPPGIFKNEKAWRQMRPQQMRAALAVEYLKYVLRKTPQKKVAALLDLKP